MPELSANAGQEIAAAVSEVRGGGGFPSKDDNRVFDSGREKSHPNVGTECELGALPSQHWQHLPTVYGGPKPVPTFPTDLKEVPHLGK